LENFIFSSGRNFFTAKGVSFFIKTQNLFLNYKSFSSLSLSLKKMSTWLALHFEISVSGDRRVRANKYATCATRSPGGTVFLSVKQKMLLPMENSLSGYPWPHFMK
jgi:hypothetical protein